VASLVVGLTLLRMRFGPRGIDVVVHVDRNGLRHHLRNARIDPICRRIHPSRREQYCTAGTHRGGQEFSPRKTGIILFNIPLIVAGKRGTRLW
jgi:hypothetical protein